MSIIKKNIKTNVLHEITFTMERIFNAKNDLLKLNSKQPFKFKKDNIMLLKTIENIKISEKNLKQLITRIKNNQQIKQKKDKLKIYHINIPDPSRCFGTDKNYTFTVANMYNTYIICFEQKGNVFIFDIFDKIKNRTIRRNNKIRAKNHNDFEKKLIEHMEHENY